MTSLITQGQQQLKLGLWSIALETFERSLIVPDPEHSFGEEREWIIEVSAWAYQTVINEALLKLSIAQE